MSPKAVNVYPVADYRLEICFKDGETKIFDVKPYIKGEFYGELADPKYFDQVYIGLLSVEWPHGQGICPDDLYLLSNPA